ncbi:MAG: thioredoxin fold domain-containing protein [Bacteroidota bacterium]|nr:thioredoxin fold domain-containing protein [Bacteroidota bacterium]MDP3144608.1 thioredoxin fold domain-containing protein [Bacteroidota bacterium]
MRISLNIILILSTVLLLPKNSFSQIKLFQFEQIDSLMKVEKRKIVVFIHTDWCKYCATMKHTTFKKDSVIEFLNKHFYFIDLNAEEKLNINFNKHTFKYKPTGASTGINELAEQLGTVDGKISYPTLCFLNSEYEIIFQYNQYINSTQLLGILARLK